MVKHYHSQMNHAHAHVRRAVTITRQPRRRSSSPRWSAVRYHTTLLPLASLAYAAPELSPVAKQSAPAAKVALPIPWKLIVVMAIAGLLLTSQARSSEAHGSIGA